MMPSVDVLLASLELPAEPLALLRELEELLKGRAPYDFVADQGAKKARDCWIACRFLVAYAEKSGRRYQVTKLMTEAPDIEYQEMGRPRGSLSIEVAEMLSPGYKRSEEYRKDKLEREACEKAGREYESTGENLPSEFLEKEKSQFPVVASEVLKKKLMMDYGVNCTLVFYVNLWLFGDEPIRDFVTTNQFPRVQVREIWFLYDGTIIPLSKQREVSGIKGTR